jgi:hypothetical protein
MIANYDSLHFLGCFNWRARRASQQASQSASQPVSQLFSLSILQFISPSAFQSFSSSAIQPFSISALQPFNTTWEKSCPDWTPHKFQQQLDKAFLPVRHFLLSPLWPSLGIPSWTCMEKVMS